MQILQASTPEQLDQVRELLRAYVEWQRSRHADFMAAVDAYFTKDMYNAEIAGLPGSYARPDGCLLLAVEDGQGAGCVAFHKVDASTCEMKRMFVRPEFQGRGIGRALAQQLISEARQTGYTRMRLEVSPLQTEAQGMYRSLGFKDVEPYYALPEVFKGLLNFLMLELE